MPQKPPASRRHGLAEVDTPALVIDLDAFERNLKRMADFTATAGVRLRAHAKTHKSPDIAASRWRWARSACAARRCRRPR